MSHKSSKGSKGLLRLKSVHWGSKGITRAQNDSPGHTGAHEKLSGLTACGLFFLAQ